MTTAVSPLQVTARSLVLLLVVGSGALAVWRWLLPDLVAVHARIEVESLSALPFGVALEATCAAALLLATGWFLLVAVAVAAEAATSSRSRLTAWCPHGMRRLLLAACGIALSSTIAAPALADPVGIDPPAVAPVTAPVTAPDSAPVVGPAATGAGHARLDGLPLPDRAVGTRRAAVRDGSVTVQDGDTLWGIARTQLAPEASDAEIGAAWRAIYARNRAVIGPDPDLIFAHTTLLLPGGTEREEQR